MSTSGVTGSDGIELVGESPVRWVIPRRGAMRVPGVVLTSRRLLPSAAGDRALEQVAAAATLPGVVEASYAMPDVHEGHGLPVGGVVATDTGAGGVVAPGGVGFDISCGVRLLAAPLYGDELGGRLGTLVDRLAVVVPRGLGRGAVRHLDARDDLDRVLAEGAAGIVRSGDGEARDLTRCEDRGRMAGADPGQVSARAAERGLHQLGSLGSGNHFLEVQVVDDVTDPDVAATFGLRAGQVCVMIHTGSRGLGHQVCTDHVGAVRSAMARAGTAVPDDRLAHAPVDSPEGRAYLGAMAAAANYGRANRQLLTEAVRDAFASVVRTRGLSLVWDVSHNLVRLEDHDLDGRSHRLCVHRKGATPALPAGHPALPEDLRAVGQPVLVPGSMGTASHVLVADGPGGAFHSSAHGAGRTVSRHTARRRWDPARLRAGLEEAGIHVQAASQEGLPEEAPGAYKDVDEVVTVTEQAGLARRVARLRPLGVVRG